MPADLDVIVISIDSLRADMPWNGYPREIAPHLSALEKKSVSYTHAYAVSSYTSMSLGGFLGGKYPSSMKRSGYFFGSYPSDDLMFPEMLHDKGVFNLGAQAHGYFKDAGFNQGFDQWEIVPGLKWSNETDLNVTGPKHEEIAERLLGDAALEKKRFFAWFHFLDPHDQYVDHRADGIEPFGKTLRDRYDAEVVFTDRWVGKLIDFIEARPWASHAMIVVTADHGEAFGEHNRYAHGFEVWENLVRVPLFFYAPGLAAKRIDEPRSNVDLAPTILQIYGGEKDAAMPGVSLVPELLAPAATAPAQRDVIVDLPMTSDSDRRRAIIHGKWKLIAFGKAESMQLFDLDADPKEDHPVMKGEDFDMMVARYRAASKDIPEVAPTQCNVGCLNREYAKKK